MSETSPNQRQVKARVLRQVRVLDSDKPQLAVLEMRTDKGSDFFMLTRESMEQIAEHLRTNAERFQRSGGTPQSIATQ